MVGSYAYVPSIRTAKEKKKRVMELEEIVLVDFMNDPRKVGILPVRRDQQHPCALNERTRELRGLAFPQRSTQYVFVARCYTCSSMGYYIQVPVVRAGSCSQK